MFSYIEEVDAAKFPKHEPLPGHPDPNSVQYISNAEELTVGDHILYLTTRPKYRKVFHSGLVAGTTGQLVEYITNEEEGVVRKSCLFCKMQGLHRVKYSECRYSIEESLERAEMRINETYYHSLNNNSHHFVTWCKQGKNIL